MTLILIDINISVFVDDSVVDLSEAHIAGGQITISENSHMEVELASHMVGEGVVMADGVEMSVEGTEMCVEGVEMVDEEEEQVPKQPCFR